MNRYDIIAALDSEIQRLQEARSAIALSRSSRVGRLPSTIKPALTRKRNGISEAGRKRIAEAQCKRWAAQKAANGVEARKEAGRSGKKTASGTAVTRIPPKQLRMWTRVRRSVAVANALSSRAGTVAVPAKRTEAA